MYLKTNPLPYPHHNFYKGLSTTMTDTSEEVDNIYAPSHT